MSEKSLIQPKPETPAQIQAAVAYAYMVRHLPQLKDRTLVVWVQSDTLHFAAHRYLTGVKVEFAIPSTDPRFARCVVRAAEAAVSLLQTSTHAVMILEQDRPVAEEGMIDA